MDTSIPLPTHTNTRPLRALAGYAGLGLLTAAGAPDFQPMAGLEATFLPIVGTLLLTAPALLVVHQYLRLKAEPRSLLVELVRSGVDMGNLALALTPAVGLFYLTTNITPAFFLCCWIACGMLCLALTVTRLIRLENQTGATLGQTIGIGTLATGWAVLAGLIALRLLVPAFFSLITFS